MVLIIQALKYLWTAYAFFVISRFSVASGTKYSRMDQVNFVEDSL